VVIEDPGAYSVVACFAVFFINDVYGFVSWRRMDKKQERETKEKNIGELSPSEEGINNEKN